MRQTVTAAIAALAIALAPNSARADDPTDALANAKVIVGIERAVSLLDYETASFTPNGSSTSSTVSLTGLSFFAADPGAAGDVFYVVPRLGVDAVLVPHVTLGGSVFAWTDVSSSASTSISGSSVSQDMPKRTYWGIAPRAGYILALTPSVALWPRVGVEYHNLSQSTVNNNNVTSGGTSLNELALDLEGNLVITPFEHIGFTVTLYGAVPLSGSISVNSSSTIGTGSTTTITTSSGSVSETAVGLTFGMLGYF